ncbi:MAG: EpsG family protein [Paludibacteraceae bacterium]|nr:EpsG family protein [Paludibacteraceae bacterium]
MPVLLIVICLVFCIMDLMAEGYRNIQRQLFNICFIVIVVLCTCKYAYGADVKHYYSFYEELTDSYAMNVANGLTNFEPGFMWFCTMCKLIGLSYWWMTVIVSLFYWGAIYWLFSNIKYHRMFALLVIVVLDNALFLEQLRQCIAVALIIYAFCFYHRYSWKIIPVLLLVASTSMHKTALPFVFFLLLGLVFSGLEIDKKAYFMLAVLLFSFMIFSLHPLLQRFLLFLPSSLQDSAGYHLMVGKRFQKVFILYFMAILCMGYYTRPINADKRERVYHWMIWSCIGVIVVLYQYYLILYRIRSYMLPFIIVWVMNTFAAKADKEQLLKQMTCLVILLFSLSLVIELPHRYKNMHGQIYRTSWVWELRKHPEKDILARQMEQATLFWEYDNNKGLQLGFK